MSICVSEWFLGVFWMKQNKRHLVFGVLLKVNTRQSCRNEGYWFLLIQHMKNLKVSRVRNIFFEDFNLTHIWLKLKWFFLISCDLEKRKYPEAKRAYMRCYTTQSLLINQRLLQQFFTIQHTLKRMTAFKFVSKPHRWRMQHGNMHITSNSSSMGALVFVIAKSCYLSAWVLTRKTKGFLCHFFYSLLPLGIVQHRLAMICLPLKYFSKNGKTLLELRMVRCSHHILQSQILTPRKEEHYLQSGHLYGYFSAGFMFTSVGVIEGKQSWEQDKTLFFQKL